MRLRVTATLALLLFVCLPVFAQQTTGTIVGAVTDTSGAVVPKATVTVTNLDTNAVVRTVTTNDAGEYAAPLLPVGHYSVQVASGGFKTSTKTGIELNVNDRLSVNIALAPGNAQETINVEANANQVETQSATSQGLITGTQVRELALSARNYEELVALMPGVSSAVADTIFVGVETPGGGTNEVDFSINGTRFSQNNWTVDGADNVDRGGNFTLLNYPSVDAIAEFKVLRSLYNPEFGRGAGGQINVITRSGTNAFHGGAYEFFRNDVLNANRFLNKHFADPTQDVPRPPLRYNDFGWTFGGPVYIPGHYNTEKNKTFFFYSEEIRRIVTSSTALVTLPNANERQGRFANPVCLDPDCNTTGTQITAINPAATAYLNDVFSKLALPQDPTTDQGTLQAANRFNYRQEIIRIDHSFSPRLTLTGRWINDSIPTINPAGLFDASNVFGYATTNTNSPGRNLLIRATGTITNNLLNEAGYSWSYGGVVSDPIGLNTVTASPNVAKAINLPFGNPLGRIPNLDFSSGSGYFGFGPYRDFNRNHNVFDNLSWVKGRHNIQVGFTYHRYQKQENAAAGSEGTFSFATSDAQLAFAQANGQDSNLFPQEWANFLLGNANAFQQNNSDFHAEIRQRMFELYAQDQYRVKPNLTLMYGLRYTRYGQPIDANNQNSSFFAPTYNPANAPTLDANGNLCLPTTVPCDGGVQPNPNFNPLNGMIISGQNSPFGKAIANTTNNFAPRIGIAWDPRGDGKTSVRTGYGVFFDAPAVGFVENNLFVNPPFIQNVTISNTLLENPGSVTPDVNNSPQFAKGVAPTWHLPYTQAWSLDVQHDFGRGVVADVGYFGNHGTHLIGIIDVNQPAPGAYLAAGIQGPITSDTFSLVNLVRPFQGYGPINESATIFSSNYHSLQASMQKRFAGGAQVSVNYTWSHALTNAGNDFSTPQDIRNLRANYGPADFDRRHIFNVNFVYQLPWMKAQQGFAGHALGGWELSGIISYESGLFLTATGTPSNIDPAGLGLLDPNANTNNLTGAPPARPDQIANPNSNAPHTADQWFNLAAFTDPPADGIRPGNAPIGSIRGPGIERWDLSLFKNFKTTERTNLQFRWEVFNVFNHTNFQGIDTDTTSSTFGQVTSTHEPRIMQLGLKFNF
jgi:Carboxypeptidase regulatory-like domain/TonB dependent receptor/TonB-dependent Receptor Plug Domain